MTAADPGEGRPAARIRRRQWLTVAGQAARTPRGAVGLGLACLVVALAVTGPFVAPRPPDALLTLPYAKPSARFPLGADFLGRDVLSRLLDGGWQLLLMAVAATAIGITAGAVAGISAAYLRGPADRLIMQAVDVILAFPQLVFALLLLSILGPRLWLIVLAVGLTHAPAVARVLRSATLDVAERDFVKVAELQGMRPAGVMAREILPSLSTPLMVEAGLRLTYSIIGIAGLAFLGFGQPPPAANWGTMINENRGGLPLNPWAVIIPATVIALLTIGTNLLADAIGLVALGTDRRPEEAALVDDLAPTDVGPKSGPGVLSQVGRKSGLGSLSRLGRESGPGSLSRMGRESGPGSLSRMGRESGPGSLSRMGRESGPGSLSRVGRKSAPGSRAP